MYELKTLVPEFQIQLPTKMYSMKNVSLSAHNCNNGFFRDKTMLSTDISTAAKKPACALDLDVLGQKIQQVLKSSNEVGAVLIRQDKVLQQLKELKAQLADIRSTLGLCQKGPQHTSKATAQTQNAGNNGGLREEPLHDIVINAHPKCIPHALLALKNAWRDLFDIYVKTFTHSTMSDVGPAAREFERKIQDTNVSASSSNKSKINVTLIWKNCDHTEMICSPTVYVPIHGEVNIIRYLGRIGPAAYRYEDSPLCNEIDLVLDICHQLLRSGASKSTSLLHALNQRLGKQNFFGGDAISVADIGVQSALSSVKDKDLTPALISWRKRVSLVTKI